MKLKTKQTKQTHKLDPDTTDTLIGEGSIFEGKIKSDAGVRVEGQILGDIECEGDVIIGEKGVVHSNINARNVLIAGTVTGNVQVRNKLSITSKGKLYGNMLAASLHIEEGSIFEGSSKMIHSNEDKQETPEQMSSSSTATQGGVPLQNSEASFKSW